MRTTRCTPEGEHRGTLHCAPPQHSVRIARWVPHGFPPAESSPDRHQDRMQNNDNIDTWRHVLGWSACCGNPGQRACWRLCVPCESTATGTTPADSQACFAQAGPLTAPVQTALARSSRRHTRCPAHPPPGMPAVTSRAGGWLRGGGDVNRSDHTVKCGLPAVHICRQQCVSLPCCWQASCEQQSRGAWHARQSVLSVRLTGLPGQGQLPLPPSLPATPWCAAVAQSHLFPHRRWVRAPASQQPPARPRCPPASPAFGGCS